MLEFIEKKGMIVCTCVEVANKKAVRVPDKWTHLKDLGKGTSTFWPIFTL